MPATICWQIGFGPSGRHFKSTSAQTRGIRWYLQNLQQARFRIQTMLRLADVQGRAKNHVGTEKLDEDFTRGTFRLTITLYN